MYKQSVPCSLCKFPHSVQCKCNQSNSVRGWPLGKQSLHFVHSLHKPMDPKSKIRYK